MKTVFILIIALMTISISCSKDDSTQATCFDNILNGNETGIDCGGACGYCIGDMGPGGGFIFYDRGIDSENWRYLEASSSDQAEAVSWGLDDVFVGNTSTTIGSGLENCNFVISKFISSGSGVGEASAIGVASNTLISEKDDWFLPSKEELLLMYQSRDLIGQFNGGKYWSSSEDTTFNSWLVNFDNGESTSDFKSQWFRVRVIRRF